MQLRRDPITQSWVNLEDEGESLAHSQDAPCPFCPGHEALSPQTLYEYPGGGSSWQVRVTPHLRPVYRIEGPATPRRGHLRQDAQPGGA